MVGLSVASCVNLGVEKVDLSIRNYVYYGLIGLLAASATLSANGTQFFFEQLNDGILKGVFTGTLVPSKTLGTDSYAAGYANGLALGLNIMVGFHTLYSALQRRVFNFAFKTSF
jgi:hypothetical protein